MTFKHYQHVLGCPKSLSVPADLCKCQGAQTDKERVIAELLAKECPMGERDLEQAYGAGYAAALESAAQLCDEWRMSTVAKEIAAEIRALKEKAAGAISVEGKS